MSGEMLGSEKGSRAKGTLFLRRIGVSRHCCPHQKQLSLFRTLLLLWAKPIHLHEKERRYCCWAGNGPSGGRTPLSWPPREFRAGTNQRCALPTFTANIAGKRKVPSYHHKRRPTSLAAYVSSPPSRRLRLCAEAIKTIPCSPALALVPVPLLPQSPPLHGHLRPFLGTGIVCRYVLRSNNTLGQREETGRCQSPRGSHQSSSK
jgi:hypothetical protein